MARLCERWPARVLLVMVVSYATRQRCESSLQLVDGVARKVTREHDPYKRFAWGRSRNAGWLNNRVWTRG